MYPDTLIGAWTPLSLNLSTSALGQRLWEGHTEASAKLARHSCKGGLGPKELKLQGAPSFQAGGFGSGLLQTDRISALLPLPTPQSSILYHPGKQGVKVDKTEGTLATELTAVGFEPTQLALVELESTPLDHSGKLSMVSGARCRTS